MKHKIRVERHLIRDILASMVGGSTVIAVVQKSRISGVLTLLTALALFITEQADIEEEESDGPK